MVLFVSMNTTCCARTRVLYFYSRYRDLLVVPLLGRDLLEKVSPWPRPDFGIFFHGRGPYVLEVLLLNIHNILHIEIGVIYYVRTVILCKIVDLSIEKQPNPHWATERLIN